MESSYELMDMIMSSNSPEQISDKIKEILFSKSSENIESISPAVSSSLFGNNSEDS
jgi:hypothetical protein